MNSDEFKGSMVAQTIAEAQVGRHVAVELAYWIAEGEAEWQTAALAALVLGEAPPK